MVHHYCSIEYEARKVGWARLQRVEDESIRTRRGVCAGKQWVPMKGLKEGGGQIVTPVTVPVSPIYEPYYLPVPVLVS